MSYAAWARKSTRIDFQSPVVITWPDAMRSIGQTKNLSPFGMFVDSSPVENPSVGTELLCEFPVKGVPKQFKGRVCWTFIPDEAANQNVGMGIEFVDLSASEQTFLDEVVRVQAISPVSRVQLEDREAVPVTVQFEGMTQPIRAKALQTPSGVRITTTLAFLRLNSAVTVNFPTTDQPAARGRLSEVSLAATIDEIPTLDVDVALKDREEPAIVSTKFAEARVDAVFPSNDNDTRAEIVEAQDRHPSIPSRFDVTTDALADDPEQRVIRLTSSVFAVTPNMVTEESSVDESEEFTEYEMPHVAEAARVIEPLPLNEEAEAFAQTLAEIGGVTQADPSWASDLHSVGNNVRFIPPTMLSLPEEDPVTDDDFRQTTRTTPWRLWIPLGVAALFLVGTVWAFFIGANPESVKIAKPTLTDTPTSAMSKSNPNVPSEVQHPAPAAQNMLADEEEELIDEEAPETDTVSTKRDSSITPTNNANPTPNTGTPHVTVVGNKTVVTISLKGSTARWKEYSVLKPDGYAVNFAEAQTTLSDGVYMVNQGSVKLVWVRPYGAGAHLRFLYTDGTSVLPKIAIRNQTLEATFELQAHAVQVTQPTRAFRSSATRSQKKQAIAAKSRREKAKSMKAASKISAATIEPKAPAMVAEQNKLASKETVVNEEAVAKESISATETPMEKANSERPSTETPTETPTETSSDVTATDSDQSTPSQDESSLILPQ